MSTTRTAIFAAHAMAVGALLALYLLGSVAFGANMALDQLPTERNARAQLVQILRDAKIRDADTVSKVSALVTKWTLATTAPLSFGFMEDVDGDNMCAIGAGGTTLTSTDNPFVAGDVGKIVDIAGAGPAGATLRSVITVFNNAGSVTINDTASTAVVPTKTSKAGHAMWGRQIAIQLRTTPLQSQNGLWNYFGDQSIISISNPSVLPIVPVSKGGTNSTTAAAARVSLGPWLDISAMGFVNVKDPVYGAVGDGLANDTVAIQAAITATPAGGVCYFPQGTYLIARTIGADDRYGLKVTANNITLMGHGAALRRFNQNIAADADAYPILFVGTPDSNVAAATTGTRVLGLRFIGENTRHAAAGQAPNDFRTAIVLKNTDGTVIERCSFSAVDSSVIYTQYPAVYNSVDARYYNTTCNYNLQVIDNEISATAHATAGRALIHAVDLTGVTTATVVGNRISWCDIAVNCGNTFNDFSDTDASTWTPTYAGWSLGAVKKIGRGHVVTGNVLSDSTENSIYAEAFDASISGNTIRISNAAMSGGHGIKVRGRGVTVSGNRVCNFSTGISVDEPSISVSVNGNSVYSSGTSTGGAIDVNSDGLSAYIAARVWMALDYKPMTSISIVGNSVEFPITAASTIAHHSAFRVYSDSVDANYPNGQIIGVTITNNSVRNYNTGIYAIGVLTRGVNVSGNSFSAKPFTRSGFAAGTALNTRAAIQVDVSGATTLQNFSFRNNTVEGANYFCCSTTGGGGAGTIDMPYGITGNTFNYVKNMKTADIRDEAALNRFICNTGLFWLDRTFSSTMIQNSLYGGAGTSELRSVFLWSGAALRFYTDDAGSFITL